MKNIYVFDTSITSDNLGDYIIMDYSNQILNELFPNEFFTYVATHDAMGRCVQKQTKSADLKFVCGTNLLSEHMNRYRKWRIGLRDLIYTQGVITLGIGWAKHSTKPYNLYTKLLLKKLLNRDYIHSTRDEYTAGRLKELGLNAINTSCPTMWKLSKAHCAQIPTEKASRCVFTITDYDKSPSHDAYLIECLLQNYEECYIWIQAHKDYAYLKELLGDTRRIHIIPPRVEAYDSFLRQDNIDYIGTRLHAGIRALNHKKRSIIISIDNRAAEIASDTNLPIIKRDNIREELIEAICKPLITEINIPIENISIWKKQFCNC